MFASIRTAEFCGKSYNYWDYKDAYFDMMQDNPDEVELRKKYLRGGTFLDVGACMGSWTIPAILMGAKVIAIEPSKSMATLLKSNLAINGMEAEAQIMQIPAWNADGNLAFDGWFSGRGSDIIQARR